MTYCECEELYFLLEELLDTDFHYILYGFPWATIKQDGTYDLGIKGIWDVGVKDPRKRTINEKQYKNNMAKIIDKYYGD